MLMDADLYCVWERHADLGDGRPYWECVHCHSLALRTDMPHVGWCVARIRALCKRLEAEQAQALLVLRAYNIAKADLLAYRKVAQYAITDMGRMQADLEAMTRRLEAADALAELRAHDFERGWHAALAEDEPKRLLPWDEYVKKVRAAAAGEELEDE